MIHEDPTMLLSCDSGCGAAFTWRPEGFLSLRNTAFHDKATDAGWLVVPSPTGWSHHCPKCRRKIEAAPAAGAAS